MHDSDINPNLTLSEKKRCSTGTQLNEILTERRSEDLISASTWFKAVMLLTLLFGVWRTSIES